MTKKSLSVHELEIPTLTKRMWNSLVRLLVCLALHSLIAHTGVVEADETSLLSDLQVLASALPGTYSNLQQYHKHAQRGLPPNKRHLLIRSEIYRMTSPMFNDSLTFYFQDFTKSSSQPFRAGFYSFSVERKMNIIRMKSFKLKTGLFIKAAYAKRSDFTINSRFAENILRAQRIHFEDFRTYGACDMYWKRLAENTFVGITGPLCLGTLGTDQVRIGVSMTLTVDRLLLTEGWYRVKDGTRITEVKVPYVLQKLQGQRQIQRDSKAPSKDSLHKVEDVVTTVEIFNPKSSLKKWRPVSDGMAPDAPGFSKISGKDRSSGKFRRRADNRKNRKRREPVDLRNFQEVASALTSGYTVHFRVELGACGAPEQASVERLSFGGKVKDFLFVRRDGTKNRRKDYIFFISRAVVTGGRGPGEVTRQITLLREGYIRVEVITSLHDPEKQKSSITYDCRLYSEETGYGGVKMMIDPSARVKQVKKFRALTKTVAKGHDLQVVADLSRCQGTHTKPSVILGTQITDYNIVNGGKTIEVFLPLVDNISSTDEDTKKHAEGFITQIFKDGDVMLTRVTHQSKFGIGSGFGLSPAYHCKLSNRVALQTNDNNVNSVKIYFNR